MKSRPAFRFRLALALVLPLLLALAPRGYAASPPADPGSPQRVQRALAPVLGLEAQQLAQLQAPMRRLLRERAAFARQDFVSAAESSAAHTLIEYRFFTAAVVILSPAQFDALVVLNAPAVNGPDRRVALR